MSRLSGVNKVNRRIRPLVVNRDEAEARQPPQLRVLIRLLYSSFFVSIS